MKLKKRIVTDVEAEVTLPYHYRNGHVFVRLAEIKSKVTQTTVFLLDDSVQFSYGMPLTPDLPSAAEPITGSQFEEAMMVVQEKLVHLFAQLNNEWRKSK